MKIADKIVTTLLAVCTLPVVLFTSLFHILYQITGADMLNSLMGIASSGDTGLTEDGISVWWILQHFRSGMLSLNGNIDYSSMDERVVKILPYFKWSVILFIVGAAIGIVLIVVCAATSSKKTQNILCGIGIADLTVCGILFKKFATPILDGTVTAGTLCDSLLGGVFNDHPLLKTLFSTILNIKELNLSSAWSLLIVIFASILLWNVAYVLTSPKEKSLSASKRKKA